MKLLKSKLNSDVKYGKNFTLVEPSNLYGCEIGDDCLVGSFVEIQNDVKIGNRTRVQSHSFICSLVEIGDDCFIGHGTMFINDTFAEKAKPEYKDSGVWKKTILENNVTIGSNVTILPVKICENVVVGAGSVVTKDITKEGFYVGNPARYLRSLE